MERTFSIGVDLGGTNLRVAAYCPASGLLDTIHMPTRLAAGREAVAADICNGISTLRTRFSTQYKLTGIGVGTPGPLELPAGILHHLPNFPGWDGFNLRAELERCLQSEIVLESDANAAALAEFALGRGRSLHADSLCMLTLGTGIGNGIILKGKVWHGANGMAGEAGHMNIDPAGRACGCGSRGCLEVFASATAVVRTARERGIAPECADSAHRLAECARAGHDAARQVFTDAGAALGIGLATLINTLNLSLYVIGGGLAQAWDLLAPSLFEEVRFRSYVYRLTAPEGRLAGSGSTAVTHIVPAELGSDAGLLGACMLPLPEGELAGIC